MPMLCKFLLVPRRRIKKIHLTIKSVKLYIILRERTSLSLVLDVHIKQKLHLIKIFHLSNDMNAAAIVKLEK